MTATTSGTGGSLASTNSYNTLELVCYDYTAGVSVGWAVTSAVGSITVV